MKSWLGRGALALIGAPLLAYGLFAWSACAAMGTAPVGERRARMERSPQWHGGQGREGRFANPLPRVDGPAGEMLQRALQSRSHKSPEGPLPVLARRRSDFAVAPASGLRVTWLGHSTLLVEIDGVTLLVDPVWGERASPVSWVGPRRFFAPPLPLSELPAIDAVLISHDHYDHLDLPTIEALRDRALQWLVPLGIGAHLEGWGVPAERIVERDWWESVRVGEVEMTCTPARHFSGRSVFFTDQNRTLWAGWAMVGPRHRVFYSGDTGLHPTFADIGQRLGPFDVTLMETGAADALWRDVHMGPEQAVIAHQLLRGRVLMPVHWGLFDLAGHTWVEPVERVLAAAERVGVSVVTPRPGASVEPTVQAWVERWWPQEVPWERAEERPVWSSSVSALLEASPLYTPLRVQQVP